MDPAIPSTQFTCLYPSFVMHKKWTKPKEFNDRLFQLAMEDARKNRVTSAHDPRNVGDLSNHLGHLRHNFLMECRDPVVSQLAEMVDLSIREYLATVYNFHHDGDITMMSDTFYQQRAQKENVGINMHTHVQHDIVCTYYPRVVLDPDCPQTSLHRGSVRFYDPANVGKRLWKNNNPNFHIGGWLSVEPQTGSMIVFEGYMPHDSTYFEGEERMCIPVLCSLVLPNSHMKTPISEIRRFQAGEEE